MAFFLVAVQAQAVQLVNAEGTALTVKAPIRLYIDVSVPAPLQAPIVEAVAEANRASGRVVFELMGLTELPEVQQMNGLSVISINKTWDQDMLSLRSRMSAYWSGSEIHEVDIRVNGVSFDLSSQPDMLKETVKRQLLRLPVR